MIIILECQPCAGLCQAAWYVIVFTLAETCEMSPGSVFARAVDELPLPFNQYSNEQLVFGGRNGLSKLGKRT